MQEGMITTQMPPRQAKTIALDEVHIDDLLRLIVEKGASDLHLAVGVPPVLRVDGKLIHTNYDRLTPRDSQRLVYDIQSCDFARGLG